MADTVDFYKEARTVLYENLYIPSFNLLHIEEFQMKQSINEHTELNFSGIVPEGAEGSMLYSSTVGCQVEVYCMFGENKKIMFRGMVTEVRVKPKGGLEFLTVKALSNTCQMDVLKVSQSYQNTGETYKELLKGVVSRTSKAKGIYGLEADRKTGELILQYKETDWGFIKRLASHFNLGLYPEFTYENAGFYFGQQEGEEAEEINIAEYSISKDIREYQLDSQNFITGAKEKNYITYEVKSDKIKKLGDKITFLGEQYYIKHAVYEMVNGIVMGTYRLCKKDGMKYRKQYNYSIVGISLSGSVVNIIRDKVQIQLDLDNKANSGYDFPYSTISASPDGSGWYCMPEKGDKVRVQFPNEKAMDCYAVSSVSGYTPQAGDTTDKMSDPNIKYLRTAAGMELILTPEGVLVNAGDGQAMCVLDNEGNVSINAAKSISVSAEENVSITAVQKLVLYAGKSLEINGVSGSVLLKEDGNTIISGEYVLEN